MNRLLRTLLLFSCFAVVLVPSRAMAAVPQSFTQQGRLLNTDGTPVTGPVRMIFNLYASSSATTAVWTETQSNVALDNGAFSVQLGSVTAFPANTWAGATMYLGVTIGNDPEMTPREQITQRPLRAHVLASRPRCGSGYGDHGIARCRAQAVSPRP